RNGREATRAETFLPVNDCGPLSDHLRPIGNSRITANTVPRPFGVRTIGSSLVTADRRLGTTEIHRFRCPARKEKRMHRLSYSLILVFMMMSALTVRAQTGMNNAELSGDYAFSFSGFSGNGTASSVFAAVGRFTADGAGNITNGELDSNTV